MLASTPTSNVVGSIVDRQVTTIFEYDTPGSQIARFEFTHDGSRIVTIDYANRVSILNASNGALVRTIMMPPKPTFLDHIAISHDNCLLAVMSLSEHLVCYLYDLNDDDSTPIHQFTLDTPHNVFNFFVVFTPTRQLLIYCSYDAPEDGGFMLVPTLPTFATTPSWTAEHDMGYTPISPNGAFVAVCSDGTNSCRILQTRSMTYIDTIFRFIHSIADDGSLISFDPSNNQYHYQRLVCGVYIQREQHTTHPIDISPSGSLYAYVRPASDHASGNILVVRQLADDAIVYTHTYPLPLGSCTFSHDGQSIVIGLLGRLGMCIFDMTTRQLAIYRYDVRDRGDARFSPTHPTHRAEVYSGRLISYELGSRDEVRRIARALVESQTREGDREQMCQGIGAIILEYLGLLRLVDMSTFAAPICMTTRSMKRKQREHDRL